ncbi:hypothetical protein Hanom_Chr16g01470701 [Helianthus anomalus]
MYEIRRRINICLVAKHVLKYDIKRGCYIDDNMNPLDFVKIFCAGTYKTGTEEISKNEESKKNETSNSEPVCSKCDESRADNVKLLKDVESLTLENKKLKENEKEFQNKITVLENEKLKIEKDFENKIKTLENEDVFWIKLEKKSFKEKETEFEGQIKSLENEKCVLNKNEIDNQKQ